MFGKYVFTENPLFYRLHQDQKKMMAMSRIFLRMVETKKLFTQSNVEDKCNNTWDNPI